MYDPESGEFAFDLKQTALELKNLSAPVMQFSEGERELMRELARPGSAIAIIMQWFIDYASYMRHTVGVVYDLNDPEQLKSARLFQERAKQLLWVRAQFEQALSGLTNERTQDHE